MKEYQNLIMGQILRLDQKLDQMQQKNIIEQKRDAEV
jgi:hypothetical protein